ncbi:RHS repeat domain-containing protein [Pseudomonas sp. B11(2017)]|uniref:RHS repeat domain-containing protein n=1 Tax=Pseudomonas sp. B11(2017) TaxID=1981748 RepID=UPI000A1D9A8A|nr:RHS repeat-associated core domain-containing protein [Pseudomonas sp. B11(2017)]
MNVHRRTPAVTVNDSRGLAVRQVAYLRTLAEDTPLGLVTRLGYDAAGRVIAQRDPRLAVPNLVHVYGLNDAPVKTDSVDAGWRLILPGTAGQVLQRWDARGFHWRSAYDPLLRLVKDEETHGADAETFVHADASADASHNLRGRTVEQTDQAGTVQWPSFGLLGETLEQSRTFGDDNAFVTRWRHGPLGARLEQTDAGGHRQQTDFDLAGQLRRVRLRLNGQATWQTVLLDARYNAAGQIVEQQAGNGAVSHWRYDPADGRLIRQQAQAGGQAPLQDFGYEYDPAGNLTRLLDHAFTPSHFANRRVDGHRAFTYDSLYRLHTASGHDDAPPSDIPGLPQPTDPADRCPYVQTYDYDHGNNLIRLRHVRDGANHTRRMFIDPASNRGVRWAEGDPEPAIGSLFDRHGNLLALQPGQPLRWNARDRLDTVTLVQRPSGPDDEERYRYSQGVRVFKRHEFHNAANLHFHEVRYLPGLEIRTKDNGETLHVITLAIGIGNVRCLHWESGQPPGIDADQLRYTLSDHLGSCVMELDARAQLISHEGYYPFGATAWMAARSSLEVGYRTIRYSGKEMDVSGLYDYGARQYAPWLQRWVAADPAGSVDGLNLYGFVENNPLRFIDAAGQSKEEWQIIRYSQFITELGTEAATALDQIYNVFTQSGTGKEMLKNLLGESVAGLAGFYGGFGAGEIFGALAPEVNAIPFVGGIITGNAGGDVATDTQNASTPSARWIRPLIPQTSAMSVAAIDRRLGFTPDKARLSPTDTANLFLNRVVGTVVPAMNVFLNMGSRSQEAEDIKNRLSPVKINKIETMLADWRSALDERWDSVQQAYAVLQRTTVHPGDVLPNVNNMTSREDLAPIRQADLQGRTKDIHAIIDRAQKLMSAYKIQGTTDNQFLLAQERRTSKSVKRH